MNPKNKTETTSLTRHSSANKKTTTASHTISSELKHNWAKTGHTHHIPYKRINND